MRRPRESCSTCNGTASPPRRSWPSGNGRSESFVVAEPPADGLPLEYRLADPALTPAERRTLLGECGHRLRQLHDAGCRSDPDRTANDPLFMISTAGVSVGSPFAVRLAKRIGERARRLDLGELADGLSRAEQCRIVRGYLGAGWDDRATRRRWLRKVVS